MGWEEQTQLWLFPGYLPQQLPLPCGLISVGEVSNGVGSCWGVLQARQGTAWPAPLWGATVWSEQRWSSAVRLDTRNPTGFNKQDGLCGPEEWNQEILKLLDSIGKVISSSRMLGAFPGIHHPSCTWLHAEAHQLGDQR